MSEQNNININEVKLNSSSMATTSTGGDESTFLNESYPLVTFDDLGIHPKVLKAVHDLGYESPTPIQEQAIPVVLSGADMIGQAQTGTGKTAAFLLPILSNINLKEPFIQCLILEPTRELAIQSAEACQNDAKYLTDFRVAPIYGGASYDNQIRSLKHGVKVVVATPGRLMDLMKRGKVDLSHVKYMVIDEADEMLRMGFIEDVEWILSNTPATRQTLLFSATMPPAIAKIAKEHLSNPVDVRIETKTTTATTVHQRYWIVSGAHKIDAMTRILEVEDYDAVIVFVRTKTDAEDVANRLLARGLACVALHGDIPQRQREKIIDRLKSGQLDLIIATDVAARGLDVDRVTHVFNYDIPYDAESYVHRIGRTGRAGRTGEAILFVSPRERRALRLIERVTNQRIEPMKMPSIADVNKARLENFKNQVLETVAEGNLEAYEEVISDLLSDDSLEIETLCAALAKMVQKDGTLLLDENEPEPKMRTFDDVDKKDRQRKPLPDAKAAPLKAFPDLNMVRFRAAVGRKDGVKPGQIVGAIANEGNIESKYIGEISIFETFSVVDLPEGMPKETMHILSRARVCGRALELREYTAEPPRGREGRDDADRHRGFDRFDRQGPRSGHDFKNFEGEHFHSHRRSRPDFVSRGPSGKSKGTFRSSYSGRREGF